ncbi:MAG: HEAT repeat domain-containing protein [Nitrospirae bacterium]|nr:HEAT repeat domain-containing protein [Nitrospirota bacterium]
MIKLLTDHMENGFLDNIIDMFKHDEKLFSLVGEMLEDERSRVRIGTVALVETLLTDAPDNILSALPGVAKVLNHTNPTIRGDAAYLLGIIGHVDALPFLTGAINDENGLVRETVIEAIEAIQKRGAARLR